LNLAGNVILNRYKKVDIALIIAYYKSTCGKSTLLGAINICTAVAFSVTTEDVTKGAEPMKEEAVLFDVDQKSLNKVM